MVAGQHQVYGCLPSKHRWEDSTALCSRARYQRSIRNYPQPLGDARSDHGLTKAARLQNEIAPKTFNSNVKWHEKRKSGSQKRYKNISDFKSPSHAASKYLTGISLKLFTAQK